MSHCFTEEAEQKNKKTEKTGHCFPNYREAKDESAGLFAVDNVCRPFLSIGCWIGGEFCTILLVTMVEGGSTHPEEDSSGSVDNTSGSSGL